MNKHNPILLVEDDSVDAMMVNRAMTDLNISARLVHHENGEDALTFLKENPESRPCIILLDLNMPRMGGLEFLEIIKKDPEFQSIPVIVLTTSAEDQDLQTSFKHSVAGYMLKPVDYSAFVDLMKDISGYWKQSKMPH